MRQISTRGITVTDTPIMALGANPLRRGVIIQNIDPKELLYASFSQSVVKNDAFRIGGNGIIALDWSMENDLYLFCDAGKTVNAVILETSGFDSYETLMLRYMAKLACEVPPV